MGIIGVVAALTIPNLTQSTGEKEKVAKVQKLYANINDAYGRATAVYGPISEWTGGNSNKNIRLGERLTEFMKITKVCNGDLSARLCMKIMPDLDNDTDFYNFGNSTYEVVLADGAAIGIYSSGCSKTPAMLFIDVDYCGTIYVDIDGPQKGKNTGGIDGFSFWVTSEGIFPIGGKYDYMGNTDANLKSYCFVKGEGCSGWVIENSNLDYLKLDSSGKCPNGIVLNWTNTSCK